MMCLISGYLLTTTFAVSDLVEVPLLVTMALIVLGAYSITLILCFFATDLIRRIASVRRTLFVSCENLFCSIVASSW